MTSKEDLLREEFEGKTLPDLLEQATEHLREEFEEKKHSPDLLVQHEERLREEFENELAELEEEAEEEA